MALNPLRVAGMPDSGYPTELDPTLKVRFVSPLLTNMSERSTDLLKYFGGPEKFDYYTEKVEWVNDDRWNRRLTHTGLTNGADTTLVVTGAARRFPVGTLLFRPSDGETVRVTEVTDENTLTISRDIYSAVVEGAWASTDEVFVSGFSMHEDADWVFRPAPFMNTSYNYSQIHAVGIKASWRRTETKLYGLENSDLDYRAAQTVAEQFVAIEDEYAHGTRFAGTSGVPGAQGGVKYYVTSANGAQVTNKASAALARKDIDDILQELAYTVGADKMARTIITGFWGKRKISSFFSGTERHQAGMAQDAGVVVDRLNTDFGVVDVLVHTAVAKDEMLFVNREQHTMGHHGQYGRPQLRALPVSGGPRLEQAFYADLSSIHRGPEAEARIYGFSLTT